MFTEPGSLPVPLGSASSYFGILDCVLLNLHSHPDFRAPIKERSDYGSATSQCKFGPGE